MTWESRNRTPRRLRPTPVEVSAARCVVHSAAAEWGPFDVVRLAALIKLGKPAEVASHGDMRVEHDTSEERFGTHGVRGVSSDDARTRADALHMWRGVSALAGWPLPAPHAFKAQVCVACGANGETGKACGECARADAEQAPSPPAGEKK